VDPERVGVAEILIKTVFRDKFFEFKQCLQQNECKSQAMYLILKFIFSYSLPIFEGYCINQQLFIGYICNSQLVSFKKFGYSRAENRNGK